MSSKVKYMPVELSPDIILEMEKYMLSLEKKIFKSDKDADKRHFEFNNQTIIKKYHETGKCSKKDFLHKEDEKKYARQLSFVYDYDGNYVGKQVFEYRYKGKKKNPENVTKLEYFEDGVNFTAVNSLTNNELMKFTLSKPRKKEKNLSKKEVNWVHKKYKKSLKKK